MLVIITSTVGCAKLKARDQLRKGVQSFKAGRFEDAVDHFQNSIKLDPNYDVARLDLRRGLRAPQVVPNLDTPENLKVVNEALQQFNIVLSEEPARRDRPAPDRLDPSQHQDVRSGRAPTN